jgi:hypothetical protein
MERFTKTLSRIYAPTALTILVSAAAPANAVPVLTAEAAAQGFGLTQFADNFPTSAAVGVPVGPLGIAFDGQKVIVTDFPGNVRVFPTDTDGQHANTVPVAQNYGDGSGGGLARLGNFLYLTTRVNAAGGVVRLNLDGTFNSVVADGIPSTAGIVADPHTGKL